MRLNRKKDAGLGSSLFFSLLLHTVFILMIVLVGSFRAIQLNEAPVYYVDVVNLPVANPRSGSPSDRSRSQAPQAQAREREVMKLPGSPPRKIPSVVSTKAKREPRPETEKEFQERLTRLERKVEGSHTESAIEALRRKVASEGGRSGIPGGKGTEAGSDYANYIQSRLRDAFALTISSSSRNPSVVVRLTINSSGKLIKYRVEKSSGDTTFEESVSRAVEQASENFPPPPGRKEFQQGFIFRPEGVGKK
jgi:colicin import membrane protein